MNTHITSPGQQRLPGQQRFSGQPRLSGLRTPYHVLGGPQGTRVPSWAERREVYRADGRTVYIVETTCPELARRDLAKLAKSGWDVTIDRAEHTNGARIAMVHSGLARVA